MKNDHRFENKPYEIGETYHRYYLAALQLTPEGYSIGALRILDYKPRTLRDRKKR